MSVVVPCHDEGELLREAVVSALRGLPRGEVEVVVVEDAVTDADTREVLDELRGRPGVTVLRNAGRRGPGGARNTGIGAARGEWVAFLDADDTLLPDSLACRLEAAELHPDASFVAGDYTDVRMDGSRRDGVERLLRAGLPPEIRDRIVRARQEGSSVRLRQPARLLIGAELVWTGTVMVRRRLLEAVGGFDEECRGGEDSNLWIRLAVRSDLLHVARPLTARRRRDGSITRNGEAIQEAGRDGIRRLLAHRELAGLRPHIRARLLRMNRTLMWYYRERGRHREGLQAALRCVRYAPLSRSSWRHLLGTVRESGRDR